MPPILNTQSCATVAHSRSVATFTLRKQLAPSRGFRTKTEPLVTRSLCASKYCPFRMLQDHPGGTLPRFGLVACECNNKKGGSGDGTTSFSVGSRRGRRRPRRCCDRPYLTRARR